MTEIPSLQTPKEPNVTMFCLTRKPSGDRLPLSWFCNPLIIGKQAFREKSAFSCSRSFRFSSHAVIINSILCCKSSPWTAAAAEIIAPNSGPSGTNKARFPVGFLVTTPSIVLAVIIARSTSRVNWILLLWKDKQAKIYTVSRMSATFSDALFTNLGSSGLKISKVIVGCMSIGNKYWGDWVVEDKQKVFAILKKAYDEGIRTYDTADVYSNGQSEILLGEFLKEYSIPRNRVVILTKVFYLTDESNPEFSFPKAMMAGTDFTKFVNRVGLSRKHIMDAADASVRRLGTYADLYQIHRFDPDTPIEETMEALHDVVKSGKARYIGASSMRAYQFIMMQNVAEKNGWTKFISMQNLYHLNYREEEREMIAYCNLTGVGIIPYSPNNKGLLARPLSSVLGDTTRGNEVPRNLTEGDKEIVNRVEILAKKHNVGMSTVALAWLLHKGANPIVGFSKPERIDDSVAAIKLKLTPEEIAYLEEPYVTKKPFISLETTKKNEF